MVTDILPYAIPLRRYCNLKRSGALASGKTWRYLHLARIIHAFLRFCKSKAIYVSLTLHVDTKLAVDGFCSF